MKPIRSVVLVALTVLATVACGSGNGLIGRRVTADNVVDVTLEQAARVLSDIGDLVNDRTASVAISVDEAPECPEEQEPVFEMSGWLPSHARLPEDPVDRRAWMNYTDLLVSCGVAYRGLSSSASRLESLRAVYEPEYLDAVFARIRERVTPERLERRNVNLDRLAEADLETRWDQLIYVTYGRSLYLGLDMWPDIDEGEVERLLDIWLKQVDDGVFDVGDLGRDATALYERMVRGAHR